MTGATRWLRFAAPIAAAALLVAGAPQGAHAARTDWGLAEPRETSVVDRYLAAYRLGDSGRLRVKETIDVRFNKVGHGIYRNFSERDVLRPGVTRPVAILAVQRCRLRAGGQDNCVAEPFSQRRTTDMLVLKIGSRNVTYPPGTVNRYVITSRTVRALRGSQRRVWHWEMVGGGWAMPITKAIIRAKVPAKPLARKCTIPIPGRRCSVERVDRRTYRTTARTLGPYTPITWRLVFPGE